MPMVGNTAREDDGPPRRYMIVDDPRIFNDSSAWVNVIPLWDLFRSLADILLHLEELADAWQRGALSEHDGLGGTRSNRNHECIRQIQAAISDAKEMEGYIWRKQSS